VSELGVVLLSLLELFFLLLSCFTCVTRFCPLSLGLQSALWEFTGDMGMVIVEGVAGGLNRDCAMGLGAMLCAYTLCRDYFIA
jgi:hypothetical protein